MPRRHEIAAAQRDLIRTMTASRTDRPKVGLFVTCLVDLVRPAIGFAAARLIAHAGCDVEVPPGQTCCGQPAYNSGDRASARALAVATIRAFASCDYVVAPSGSCAAMLKLHVPKLLAEDGDMAGEAAAFGARVHELTSFLVNERRLASVPGRFTGCIVYHDACSASRELGLENEPRQLLDMVPGVTRVEMTDRQSCCGFGGLFSIKYPDVSTAMADRKIAAIGAADLVVGPDLGCLMNIAGRARRLGRPLACRHIAEVLAGELDAPPIGAAS